MVLTVALAAPAAAQKQVPFKGTLQAQETDSGSPPIISVTGTGTGIGTHVGRFSLSYEFRVNVTNGTGTGSAQLTAANGDIIDATVVGSSEPTATPGVRSITEIYTITGGTGRFAGAQGSFVVERLLDLATHLTSGSFHGTITSPGAAHADADED